MTDEGWLLADGRCLGVRYSVTSRSKAGTGQPHAFVLLLNAGPTPECFMLPNPRPDERWRCVLDTLTQNGVPPSDATPSSSRTVAPHSLVLLVSES